MWSIYFVGAIIVAAIAYVAIQKTENDGTHLLPSQYLSVLACGLLWPVVAIILVIDFWPRSEKIEDDVEDIE